MARWRRDGTAQPPANKISQDREDVVHGIARDPDIQLLPSARSAGPQDTIGIAVDLRHICVCQVGMNVLQAKQVVDQPVPSGLAPSCCWVGDWGRGASLIREVKDAVPALLFGQNDGAFRPDSPWLSALPVPGLRAGLQ